MAISESIFNSSTTAATTASATSLLVLSLQDVVNTWQELSTPSSANVDGTVVLGAKSICHSPQVLLDACYHAALADMTATATATANTGSIDDSTRGGGGGSNFPHTFSATSSGTTTPLSYSTNQEVMVLDSIGAAKDALGVILSSARRVTHRTLPDQGTGLPTQTRS